MKLILRLVKSSYQRYLQIHPLFTLSLGLLSPPNPSFWICKVRKYYLNVNMKCWNSVRISAFNAQGSRGIIVAVQVGAVKIYVAAVEALRKKERHGETQEPSKLMVFWVSPPTLNANVLWCRFFFKISPCVWPNSGY
jgi:hypothetical protein